MFLQNPQRSLLITLLFGLTTCGDLAAQIEFWSRSGTSDVDGATDGTTIADQLSSNTYQGYAGEMVLMPTDPSLLDGFAPGTPGIIEGDAGDTYAGVKGLVGFCIDSETSFRTSSDQSERFSYSSHTYAQANARYISDGAAFYRPGGLLRAAYLMDKFYVQAHAAGDIEAASLQAAIWEVLYDANPNVSSGQGNYYVRNDAGSTLTGRSAQIAAQTSAWFSAANSDNWGGASYDPDDKVVFWLDPNDTNNNQSIITLNPWAGAVPVPESGVPALLIISGAVWAFRRERSAV